jgi:hypothetical protein
MRKFLTSLSLLFLVGACGGQQEGLRSDLSISNGKEIDESEFPSVVLLFDEAKGAVCTGTFIDPQTVLTAAHCTMGGQNVDPETGEVRNHKIYIARNLDIRTKQVDKIAASVQIFRNPKWDSEFKKRQVNSLDLGVIRFPPRTSRHYTEISSTPVEVGDPLIVVGYGLDYVPRSTVGVDSSSIGVKRAGTNKVAEVTSGFIAFSGARTTTTADGSKVNSSMGDSGGPMFVNDKLVGITSGGGVDLFGRAASLHVDLQTEQSKEFLSSLGITY